MNISFLFTDLSPIVLIENMINIYNHELLIGFLHMMCSTHASQICETDDTNNHYSHFTTHAEWRGQLLFSILYNLKVMYMCLQHTYFDQRVLFIRE